MNRFRALSATMQRASVQALAAVAPRAADRLIVNRFVTPVRRGADARAPLAAPRMIESDGRAIAVYEAGSGPRVLLVHGWEGSALDFAALAATFRTNGFRVVAFDHPAHGRSAGRRTSLPKMARAVEDVARAVGPFDVVVGHSLGASAALLALGNGLAARAAALIAPPRDAHHFVRQLSAAMGLSEARATGAIALLERRVGSLAGPATDRVARQLRLPGLVLHDRGDRYVPFAHGEAIAAAWPGARFVPLTGLGHRRGLDAPHVHATILNFVEDTLQ
jgi:pimeloyl-ACP methyl ester carboxylesterase